jgi:hypothetical protein
VEGSLLSWEVGKRKGSMVTRTRSIREIEKAIEARSSSKVPLMYQLILVAESLEDSTFSTYALAIHVPIQ